MANIKSVIFDLDGTLLDTIEDLGDSVNEVLVARGYPTHSYEEYCFFIGDGMENLIKRSLPNECLTDERLIEEVLIDYREAYTRNWNKKKSDCTNNINHKEFQSSGSIQLNPLPIISKI